MKISVMTRKGETEYEFTDSSTVKDLKKAFEKKSK